jgi:tetratricopeptide (TPR) repeat protein
MSLAGDKPRRTRNRDDFLPRTKRAVETRANGRCSFRGCGRPTAGPSAESPEAVNRIGKAAHIHAAAPGPGARRYLASMSREERIHIDNAIWLCATHADMIDRDDVTFTADDLRAMKREREANCAKELELQSAYFVGESIPDLIAIGPNIVFRGEVLGFEDAMWSFHLRNFVDGDDYTLVAFIERFEQTVAIDRYVLVNDLGNGWMLKAAPSMTKEKNGDCIVRCPVLPSADRIRAADLPRTWALSDDHEVKTQGGNWAAVSGFGALPQQVKTCLSHQKGESPLYQDFGTRFAEYYRLFSDSPWLVRLLKLEVIRQAAIPHFDTINNRQHTPLECVERVYGIEVLGKAPTKNWLPIRIDLEIKGVGRWKHDLSVCIPQDPISRPSFNDIPQHRVFHDIPERLLTFTGRRRELNDLNSILNNNAVPAAITQSRAGITAIGGLGGIGKTSLAVQYAHEFRSLYAGVWRCPAETREGLAQSLTELGIELGMVVPDGINLDRSARLALDRLAREVNPWLLIYDNVPDPEHIQGLLPSAGARVLITSRFMDWRSIAKEVRLGVLSAEEAVGLLQKRSDRIDPPGAKILSESLGYLPLALDHAAAYCRWTGMRFQDYAIKAETLMSYKPRAAIYPLSVSVTFDLAIQEAVRHCADSDSVMDFLAFGAPERMPLSLIVGALNDETRLNAALEALAQFSLLQFDPLEDGTLAVTLHRLVLAVGRARTEKKGRTAEVVSQLLTRLTTVYPRDGYIDPACWSVCERLTPHLLTLDEVVMPTTEIGAGWAELMNRAGNFLHGNGNYAASELLLRKAVEVGSKMLGRSEPRVGAWLNDYAFVLSETGRSPEAEPLLREAITIGEQARGRMSVDVANAISNLASLLRDSHRHIEAEPLFRESLSISRLLFGGNSREVATDLVNLASVLRIRGEFIEAENLLREAIAIDEQQYGSNHAEVRADWCNFADLLIAADRPEEALSIAEKALVAQEREFGRENRISIDLAETTADALTALDRTAEAKALRARFRIASSENE